MANLFSKKLYVQGLKKIKISGIAFSLIIIILNAFLPIIGILDGSPRYRGAELVRYNQVVPFCMLIMILVPIIAHDMFSFLNERKQSDFYHSIPNKRICVYTSFSAAVLTWAFGTIIASTAVNTLLWSMARSYTFTFGTMLFGMLPYLVLSVQLAGVMILAMTVTGTKISNFLVAILFLLFFRVMSAFSVAALEEITPILNIDYSIFKYFNVNFFLPFALIEGIFDGDASVYFDAKLQIYSLVIGIVFIALGALAYVKRRSEIATQSAPSKLLQHVYRIAVTLPFVFLVAFSMIMDGIEGYQIILALLAFLIYVLYELITTKKIKNVIKSLPLLAIPVLATILTVSGIFVVSNSVYRDTFEAEEVEGFCFVEQYRSTYETYNTEKIFVSDAAGAKMIVDAFAATVNNKYDYTYHATVFENLLIKLKSGRVIARDLTFLKNDHAMLEQIIVNSPEYSEKFLELPSPNRVKGVTVYGSYYSEKAENNELYACFYEEYNKLSREDQMAVKYPRGEFNSVVQIGVSGYYESRAFTSNYHIFYEYMPKTASKYLEMVTDEYMNGYNDELEYNKKELEYYVEQAEKGNVRRAYGSVTFAKIVGSFEGQSTEYYVKEDNVKTVMLINDILDVILSEKNSFVFDNPQNLYKVTLHLDLELYENEQYVDRNYNDFKEMPIADVETSEVWPYFYMNNEIYVNISDANMAVIKGIINNYYNDIAEVTPNS